MDGTRDLLVKLTRCGIVLQVSDGQILHVAPKGVFTAELKSGLCSYKSEILSLCCGSPMINAYNRIGDLREADIVSRNEGDAAYAWIKASDHWQIISAAADEVDRIGMGNSEERFAASYDWITAWIEAIASWRERHPSHELRQDRPAWDSAEKTTRLDMVTI